MPKTVYVTALAMKKDAKKFKSDGLHAVGNPPGLALEVKGASRLWMLRYVASGKRRQMCLGSFDDIGLEQARERARAERAKIKAGADPIAERKASKLTEAVAVAKLITFDECAEKFIAAHEAGWKNAKHVQQWQNTLATYAGPLVGKLPVAAVDTNLVLQILEPIWQTKTETATRLRGRIEQILEWATVRGYRQGENPARWKGHLDKLLAKKSKIINRRNQAALPYTRIGTFMAALRQREGIGARALEFAILTAVRSVEVRGATWGEIDLVGKLWSIPASRMKMKRPHRIPLSDAAIDLLKGMPRMEGTDLVFPGLRNKPMSDATLNAAIDRLHKASTDAGEEGWLEAPDANDPTAPRRVVVQHGFRSTFRDWAAEQTAYPRELAEMALAHIVGSSVEQAYQRGDLLDKRRRLMADWATYATTPKPATENVVVPIRGAA